MNGIGIRRVGRVALAALLLALALECASGGRRFNADLVPAIQRGRWTQREVRTRFGEPTGVQVRGSGKQIWNYRYEQSQTRDTGTLFRIGAFITALLGGPSVSPPIGVRSTNTTVDSLDVEFDERGVVTDYTYSRQSRPDREVY